MYTILVACTDDGLKVVQSVVLNDTLFGYNPSKLEFNLYGIDFDKVKSILRGIDFEGHVFIEVAGVYYDKEGNILNNMMGTNT